MLGLWRGGAQAAFFECALSKPQQLLTLWSVSWYNGVALVPHANVIAALNGDRIQGFSATGNEVGGVLARFFLFSLLSLTSSLACRARSWFVLSLPCLQGESV